MIRPLLQTALDVLALHARVLRLEIQVRLLHHAQMARRCVLTETERYEVVSLMEHYATHAALVSTLPRTRVTASALRKLLDHAGIEHGRRSAC